jgi:hypothetical protein
MPRISPTLKKTKENLRAAGVSLRSFSKISGMPLSTLSDIFNGKFGLRPEKEEKLLALSIRALEMTEGLRPLTFLSGTKPLAALILSDKSPEEVRQLVNHIFKQ